MGIFTTLILEFNLLVIVYIGSYRSCHLIQIIYETSKRNVFKASL